MENRLTGLFRTGKKNLLSVYYTAGYPSLEDTLHIAESLEANGVDLIEIGIPFSDPIADGPVIQETNEKALKNGMNLKVLFSQLKDLRTKVRIPVLLMGYFNPVYQFGVEEFCARCQETGIDGLIIPDMPLWEYENQWKGILEKYGLFNIFLVTPQTKTERIRKIDQLSSSFIYLVSVASVTGARSAVSEGQVEYFERISAMQLKSPVLIGFGISNHQTFTNACLHARGAIIGSAFVKAIENLPEGNSRYEPVEKFISTIRGNE